MAKFDGRGLCVALFGLSGMAATAIASTAIAASPAKSGQPLAALSRLEPGLWQIRELNNDRAVPQSICIGDPAMLMQVKHSSAPCSMLVIANEADGATVHYTCPANGYGRTSLRVETSRLAVIDTQGIIDKAPFAFRAEARQVGSCGQKRSARR